MKFLFLQRASAFWFILLCYVSLTQPMLACQCRARVSATKANMHSLQTMVEIYAANHDGNYPANLNLLEAAARNEHYWRDLKNPYTLASGYGKSYQSLAHWKNIAVHEALQVQYRWGLRLRARGYSKIKVRSSKQPGLVLYEYLSPSHYRIYGVRKGKQLIQDRGKVFFLSNV